MAPDNVHTYTRRVPARLLRQTALWLVAFAGILVYFLLRYVVLKLPALPVSMVGPLQVSTFGPLVAMGILFGRHLIASWCPTFGLEWATLREGIVWFLLGGFGLAHLLAMGEVSPANVLHPVHLFASRAGFSSFGGFLGGTLAAVVFCKRRALALRPVLDCVLYGLIGGWLFGRLGCFSVHDHPGVPTAFPTGVRIQGVLRHDLGLYELLFTLGLFTFLTLAMRRHRRFDGFVVAMTATTYALVRFGLDFLRVSDATYAGLTLAQWGCLPLFALGVHTFRRSPWWRQQPSIRKSRGSRCYGSDRLSCVLFPAPGLFVARHPRGR
jgi:phosphatidylglycerol:prolipoprotein diacylglycerol transferase